MIRLSVTLVMLSLLLFSCPPAPNSGALTKNSDFSVPPRSTAENPTAENPAAGSPATPVSTTDNPIVATTQRPRNLIFLIGDGMGVTQISAGMFSNGNTLELERFPVVGLHKSYSGDNLVTDSAAGATAFSAGVKTYNGAIGVDLDTVAVRTILERAEARGMATGLVATSSIVHATPASFIAHDKYRKNYEAIAADFLDVEVDLLIGGGKKFFDRREDGRDLLAIWRERGYFVSHYFDEDFVDFVAPPGKNVVYLTADAEPLPYAQGRDYLERATRLSINHLADKAGEVGFLLVIEGSQIDWGGHANESEYIISEMLEFDRAVGHALDFAERDGNTLVLVTADHETGGYAIQYGSKMDSIVPAFTSDYHTADLIPVFARGPGARAFGGIYENTAIHDKLLELFGFVH